MISKTSAWYGGATVVPVASMFVDDWLITKEFKRYKTKLGIPEEESDEFKKLDPTSKAKVSVALKLLTKITPNSIGTSLTAAFSLEVGIKPAFSFLPAGLIILGPLSGGYTYTILVNILKNMADTAFARRSSHRKKNSLHGKRFYYFSLFKSATFVIKHCNQNIFLKVKTLALKLNPSPSPVWDKNNTP